MLDGRPCSMPSSRARTAALPRCNRQISATLVLLTKRTTGTALKWTLLRILLEFLQVGVACCGEVLVSVFTREGQRGCAGRDGGFSDDDAHRKSPAARRACSCSRPPPDLLHAPPLPRCSASSSTPPCRGPSAPTCGPSRPSNGCSSASLLSPRVREGPPQPGAGPATPPPRQPCLPVVQRRPAAACGASASGGSSPVKPSPPWV
jgi:hypothetical protein